VLEVSSRYAARLVARTCYAVIQLAQVAVLFFIGVCS